VTRTHPPIALACAFVVVLTSACWRSPCCSSDDECAEYATCFEGLCRARCTHESMCVEGERCEDGVCLAERRRESHCPFDPVDVVPFDAGPPDVDAGPPPPPEDAGTTLCDGPEEPNDAPASASTALNGSYDICASDDEDFFAIELAENDRIDARIFFEHDDGDLDLELWAPSGETLERSQGVGDEERVRRVVENAGIYSVRVYGFAGATNGYNITFVVEAAP